MGLVSRYLQGAYQPYATEYFDNAEVASEQYARTYSPSEWATSGLSDKDSGFLYEGYVPTTVDPDWWFTIYIIAGCLLVNLSLPFFIYLGKRWGFHETVDGRKNKKAVWESSNNTKFKSGEDGLMKQIDDARSVVSGISYAPGDEGGAAGPAGSVAGSIAMSRAGTHLGFLHSPGDMFDDSASIFSGASGFTDAVLGARVKRAPHARKRAARAKRNIVSKSSVMGDDENDKSEHTRGFDGAKKRLDIRMAAEFTKAEMDLAKERSQQEKDPYGNITPKTSASEVDFGDDSRSDAAPSVLSKLDADAISVRDAVDARDGGLVKMGTQSLNRRKHGFVSGAWNRLMVIADWDKEMKKYLALTGHFSAQGILVEIFGLLEIAAISRGIGQREADAYMIVSTVTGFTGTITTGFYESCGVLIPQANGTGNNLMIGRYMQLGIFFYMVSMLPGAVFWSFYTERALTWYKYDEETARMGQLYLWATLPGYISYGIDAVFYELLNTVGREAYATWFTVVSSIIHSGSVVAMVYWGVKDLWILGLFETASGFIFLFANFGIMYYRGWLDEYWEGLISTNGLRDWRAVKNVVNTALPLSFAWILTYGEWEIMTFFCRSMGDRGAEVTAWNYMGYLWSAFETLTDGFGDAAEVRVGFRMGSGQVRLAKLATDKALYVALITAVYATGILFVLAMYIPGFLTNDPVIQRMIFDIIPLVGFGQILFVWGMVAWAILSAQGRIRVATALEFFISWGIGAPVAAILVFMFNYNIEGIIGGLTIGYTIGTNVYLYMLHTSDWENLSAVVVARNAAEGKIYSDFDWDDLPDNIQDAAVTLGYNKWIWESDDLQAPSDDKDWEELTSAERKAAGLLGYNKRSWNSDDETDESSGQKKSNDDTRSVDSADSDCWANLSKEARGAALILGYTEAIWDNDGSAPSEEKDWDELSPREQSAAQTLGYTMKKWNGEDDDGSNESYHTPKTSEAGSELNLSMQSSTGSALEQMIRSACSFDSNSDPAEGVTSSISNGLSSLLGYSYSNDEEEK